MESVEFIINSLETETEIFELIEFIINSIDEKERMKALELMTLFLVNE